MYSMMPIINHACFSYWKFDKRVDFRSVYHRERKKRTVNYVMEMLIGWIVVIISLICMSNCHVVYLKYMQF